MDWAKAALVFAFLALAARSVNGQTIYYDDGTGIRQVGITDPTVDGSVLPGRRRRMCLSQNGVIFHTNGGDEVFDANTGDVIFTAPDGAIIDGLDCCCQLVVVTYELDDCFYVAVWSVDTPNIRVLHKIATAGSEDENLPSDSEVVVKCSIRAGLIVVVSRRFIWIITYEDLDTILQLRITDGFDLFTRPHCVACRSIGDNQYQIFVSVFGATSIFTMTVDLDGQVVTNPNSQFINGPNGAISINCIAYDGNSDDLYFIGAAGDEDFTIESVDANDLGGVREMETLDTTGELPDDVNGLNLCDADCSTRDCTVFECDCADVEACGFCFFPGSECQCENSNSGICDYTLTSQDEECRVCEDALDVCLIIYNPLYQRRSPGVVKVIGVTTEDNVEIDVGRYVTIGRFSPAAWPKPNEAVDVTGSVAGDVYYSGFRAPLTANLRGSRSGVYRGIFLDTDTDVEEIIPGIVTENSGFYQSLYTYTVSVDDAVALRTTTNMNVAQFRNSFVWRFTPNSGPPVDNTPRCDLDATRETCTMEDVTTDDEGSYEVYRRQRNRRLRNWHPIIYLCVRQCPSGFYGPPSCLLECPDCVNGVCDQGCGTCVCSPGWTGTLCDAACGLGEIGRNCDVNCDDLGLFGDKPNCEGLLICYPRKVGCACIPGKKPPSCTMDCDENFFGSNCLRECNPDCDDVCDPRTGTCTITP